MTSIYETAERNMAIAESSANNALGTAMNTGFAWFNMMMNFQRQMQSASLQSLSSYSPTSDTRITGRLPNAPTGATVISVGEERLNVATHTIQGETTRIRRRVVAQPVEQQVTLRDETVVMERRPATGTDPKPNVLTETIVEMSDSHQVSTVWKSVHVAEEVVLRKQVTERIEKVRETVRRDIVDVEHVASTTKATHEIAAQAEVPHLHAAPGEGEHRGSSNREAAQLNVEKRANNDLGDKKPATPVAIPTPSPHKN